MTKDVTTNTNLIEEGSVTDGYMFPEIDRSAETYFESASPEGSGSDTCIYPYGFGNIPEMKKLFAERAAGALSDAEILEIAKTAFRSKPKEAGTDGADETERQVVDFVYEF